MEIKPKEMNLEQLLSGSDIEYLVPDYQRDYSWQREQVEELWTDIVMSVSNGTEYFMGTLVLNKENHKNDNKLDIIDGQQRLATFTIIFSTIRAIASAYEKNTETLPNVKHSSRTAALARRICELAEERIAKKSTYHDDFRITLNKKDKAIFIKNIQENKGLLSGDGLRIINSESRIIKAKKVLHKIFRSKYFDSPTALDDIAKLQDHLFTKLQFISIEVASDYDAYLLFESLNSKGLDLSIADLVKNKMLMVCNEDEDKKKKVLQNWEEMCRQIIDQSQRNNPVDFLRYYWLAYKNPTVTRKELYKEIKKEIEEEDYPIVEFSEELLRQAEIFVQITNQSLKWPSTSFKVGTAEQYLAEINTLQYLLCIPSLLYAYGNKPYAKSTDKLRSLTKMSVAFLFQIITVGSQSVGIANTAFQEVLQALKKEEDIEDIKKIFVNTMERNHITDDTFKQSLSTFRTERSKTSGYILTKIHVHIHGKELIPNDYHVEHILPQKTKKWIENGFDKKTHQMADLIYNIGNMTLLDTTLNISISNDIFSKKILSYKESKFPMTCDLHKRYINKKFEWTLEEITDRAKEFSKYSTEIWPIEP